jgi:hypothetical protein
MPAVAIKKEKPENITVVKKMKDYKNDPSFKKKAAKAIAFLNKHDLPGSFKKKIK